MLVFAVDIAGYITQLMDIRNHWLYNIRDPFLYLALTYIYQLQLRNKLIQKIIRVFYISFPIFVIINSHFIQGIVSLQTLTFVVGGSFITFLAGAYFWQLYVSEESEKITYDPFFWFSFGFLLYFGCTLPFLGMLNYLWELSQEFTIFYHTYISVAFSMLLNILIIVGFLCRTNYQKSS